jgi:GNAT superfamily N-acetyltransferase
MINFEKINIERIDVIVEITNSNPDYNQMENGFSTRSIDVIKQEYFDTSNQSETYFIKLDDTYIGLINFLENNPRDGFPWLGLLMIHRDYQGYGFGSNAFLSFEESIKLKGITSLRLGILPKNDSAKSFWKSHGFQYVENKTSTNGIEVEVYEKNYSN